MRSLIAFGHDALTILTNGIGRNIIAFLAGFAAVIAIARGIKATAGALVFSVRAAAVIDAVFVLTGTTVPISRAVASTEICDITVHGTASHFIGGVHGHDALTGLAVELTIGQTAELMRGLCRIVIICFVRIFGVFIPIFGVAIIDIAAVFASFLTNINAVDAGFCAFGIIIGANIVIEIVRIIAQVAILGSARRILDKSKFAFNPLRRADITFG